MQDIIGFSFFVGGVLVACVGLLFAACSLFVSGALAIQCLLAGLVGAGIGCLLAGTGDLILND